MKKCKIIKLIIIIVHLNYKNVYNIYFKFLTGAKIKNGANID